MEYPVHVYNAYTNVSKSPCSLDDRFFFFLFAFLISENVEVSTIFMLWKRKALRGNSEERESCATKLYFFEISDGLFSKL